MLTVRRACLAPLQLAERVVVRVHDRELPPGAALEREVQIRAWFADPDGMARALPELFVAVVHCADVFARGLERDVVLQGVRVEEGAGDGDELRRKLAEFAGLQSGSHGSRSRWCL